MTLPARCPMDRTNDELGKTFLHGRSPERGRRHASPGGVPDRGRQLEEAILQKPELRGPAHRQSVRDLRSLRDAAFTLWSYGRHADCERLLANIRELISAPSMGRLGDNDEDEAEKQITARDPKVQRGATQGHRGEKDAKPLIQIDELSPGLRADETIGADVRSSDDKIVGEVRNIVFATKD